MTPNDVIAGRAKWCLVQGDCRVVLNRIAGYSCALLLTDVPYAVSHGDEDAIEMVGRKKLGRNFGAWDQDEAEIRATIELAIRASALLVRPAGAAYVFTSDRLFGSVTAWLGEYFAGGRGGHLVWAKINPMPSVRKAGWVMADELCAYQHRKAHRFVFPGQRDAWSVIHEPTVHHAHRRHPTEKPVRLLQRIIAATTKPGDVVLDPFAGSGSTGEAALRLGRRFIGIELDAAHHANALRRLSGLTEEKKRARRG